MNIVYLLLALLGYIGFVYIMVQLASDPFEDKNNE